MTPFDAPPSFPTWAVVLFSAALIASFVLFGFVEAKRQQREERQAGTREATAPDNAS